MLLTHNIANAKNLFYIADILQETVADKTIYDSRPLMIPTPNFIVSYNGRDKIPERMELKLSDSFLIPTDSPELELKGMELRDAVIKAVDECIREGILKDFLINQS